MAGARSLAVRRTWRSKETRRLRSVAYRKAASDPDVIRRKVAGTRRFWAERPKKKRGGGRPKGTPQSAETKRKIGLGAKKAWQDKASAFYLVDYDFWIEVKGAMMSGPMKRFNEFRAAYPNIGIALLDRELLVELEIL